MWEWQLESLGPTVMGWMQIIHFLSETEFDLREFTPLGLLTSFFINCFCPPAFSGNFDKCLMRASSISSP
jgi:hypothetical protein